ncbi:NUDIX domain protein [Caballeronia calidae]|uniref:NUDIX domain protein n=1 Tax=Caballeronia calidae TaxID=1777139 RepID=A0A158A6K6_9BURK|nr:NUDIX domain-containing protein [Caballeronia calidae]SAK53474.1 NUDIX domain protein [Caballeronia calidae]
MTSNDCAGILFRAPGPLYLLVERSDTGEWEQSGGHAEGDETPEQAAVRETVEEIGGCPEGIRWAVRRNEIPGAGGEYTCFLQNVPEPFKSQLNDEHTAWNWYAPDALPEKMHPEVARTIALVTGNELDIAKRMAAGELLSPQRFENMWLFDLRITGTGTSYRMALDEYVYRPPENFLTEEFRQRCNGLPVIFEHPKKNVLDSSEYRDRNIGSIFLPYLTDTEVRGVAKVFDSDGAELMLASHESTSPAVVFRDAGSTETVEVDGKSVLIEGKPSYLDHLAICEEGVWDKGGEPSGVNTGETQMDGMEEQVPAWADAFMKSCADSFGQLNARMDSITNKGGDEMPTKPLTDSAEGAAEKEGEKEMHLEREAESDIEKAVKAGEAEHGDEKRADSAEKEGEEEKADAAARADSQKRLERENADLRAQIKRMDGTLSTLTRPLSATDRDSLAQAQTRADSVMSMFGNSASAPLHGESPIDYRRRLASSLQKHSAEMKGVKLEALDGAMFKMAEDRIYADAQTAAMNPAEAPAGRLVEHVSHDVAGRKITRFSGDMDAWLTPFKATGTSVKFIREKQGA